MQTAPYRSLLIVPAAQRAAGNALAAEVTGGDPAVEADTYSVPLRAGGTGDATHYACCPAVNPDMLTRMAAVLMAGDLPGIRFYRWDAETLELLSTNSPNSATIIGTTWGWQPALADAGLEIPAGAISA